MALTTINTSILETSCGKGQDFVAQGKKSNGESWYVVLDGHGTDKVINALRKLDYLTIMDSKDPASIIDKYVKNMGDTFKSGSTMSIVIISPYKISCYWRGDSTIKIWGDGVEVFASENHNSNNPSEVERMEMMGITTVDSWAPKIIDDKTLTMVSVPYYILHTTTNDNGGILYDPLNMTNAMGHNGKTGGEISQAHIDLIPGKNYCMVAATDGLWDVLYDGDEIYKYGNAMDLTELATRRWKQEWRYVYPGSSDQITRIPKGDDIGIAFWKGETHHLD